MQRYSVNITAQAYEEIRDIKIHITYKLREPELASIVSEDIIYSAESLEVFPKIHRVRKKDREGRGLRFLPTGSYIIIYCVDDERLAVDVLHVVYERRNLEALMH